MKKWVLQNTVTGRVAHQFYQETAPGEEYLGAFRAASDPDWSLTEYTLDYYEELGYVLSMRSLEYPPTSELADALWHQQNGNEAPMTAYIAACAAVKTKWPKPAIPT